MKKDIIARSLTTPLTLYQKFLVVTLNEDYKGHNYNSKNKHQGGYSLVRKSGKELILLWSMFSLSSLTEVS